MTQKVVLQDYLGKTITASELTLSKIPYFQGMLNQLECMNVAAKYDDQNNLTLCLRDTDLVVNVLSPILSYVEHDFDYFYLIDNLPPLDISFPHLLKVANFLMADIVLKDGIATDFWQLLSILNPPEIVVVKGERNTVVIEHQYRFGISRRIQKKAPVLSRTPRAQVFSVVFRANSCALEVMFAVCEELSQDNGANLGEFAKALNKNYNLVNVLFSYFKAILTNSDIYGLKMRRRAYATAKDFCSKLFTKKQLLTLTQFDIELSAEENKLLKAIRHEKQNS